VLDDVVELVDEVVANVLVETLLSEGAGARRRR